MKFLDNIFAELKDKIDSKKGSDFFADDFKKFFAEPKTKTINPNNEDNSVTNNDCLYYQIFIETKGDIFLEHDDWKEKFLEEITQRYGLKKVIRAENKNYKLIGLPFFNNDDNKDFVDKYNLLI